MVIWAEIAHLLGALTPVTPLPALMGPIVKRTVSSRPLIGHESRCMSPNPYPLHPSHPLKFSLSLQCTPTLPTQQAFVLIQLPHSNPAPPTPLIPPLIEYKLQQYVGLCGPSSKLRQNNHLLWQIINLTHLHLSFLNTSCQSFISCPVHHHQMWFRTVMISDLFWKYTIDLFQKRKRKKHT